MKRITQLLDRAYSFQEKGDFSQALYFYKKSVEKAPDRYEGWFEMGSCFYSMEDYERSLECTLKASGLCSDQEQIWYNAAIACSALGRNEEALCYYQKALDIYPRYFAALVLKANTHLQLENYREALQDLTDAIQHPAADSMELNRLLLERAECYFKLDALDFSIMDYTTLLKRDPKNGQALKERGYLFYLQNRMDAALNDTNAALELIQDHSLLLQRGAIFLKMRRDDEACKDFMTLEA